LHGDDGRMYQALAQVEVEEKNPAAAIAALRQGLAKLPRPQQIDLLWNLVHIHLNQGQNEEAQGLIARLVKEAFPQPGVDYLQGRLLVNQEKWGEAARLLEGTYPLLQGAKARHKSWITFSIAQECNFLLARCFERMGDPYRAAAVYERVVAREPASVPGRLGLARMEWAMGRLDNALRQYHQLLEAPTIPAAACIEGAQLLIVQQLKNAPKRLTGIPLTPDPSPRRGEGREAQPNWAAVNKLLDLAATLKPVPVEVALLRAEILAAEEQFDLARELLGTAYPDIKARPVEVWVQLCALEQRQGNREKALGVLNEAEQHLGDRLELRVARARYWAWRGGSDAVAALVTLGQGGEKWPQADQRRLARELAEAYARIGEAKRAEAEWRKIAGRWKSDIASRLVLFDLALASGDESAMGRLVRELKEDIEGEEKGTLWRYCQACRLIRQAQIQEDKKNKKEGLDEAKRLLAVVVSGRVGWHPALVAQAQIDEQLGRFEEAIRKYREAIALGNQNPAVIRRVAVWLANNKRFLEADAILQKLGDQPGNLCDLDRVAAEVALANKNPQALDLARKAVSPLSKDYRDHIWLGQILAAAGKPAEAESALREALALSPTNPDPWVALVQFFHRHGEKAKAEATLLQAQAKIPADQALLPLAQCHELLGQIEKASQLFEAALAARPQDPAVLEAVALFHLRRDDRAKAQVFLEKIIGLQAIPVKDKAKARRDLAVVMAAPGGFQQTQKALEMLGLGKNISPKDDPGQSADANLADERAKMVILAQQTSPRQRRQAIAILQQLARLQVISNEEQFLLGQLYESVGEWPKAREQLLSLLTATEAKLEQAGNAKAKEGEAFATYLTYFCTGLVRHDSLGEAQTWLAKLETVEPATLRTLGTKARVLAKQGRGAEAVAPLAALAEKKPDLVQTVAALLEEIGQDKEAEKMYRRLVTQSRSKAPESVLVLAQFLGRRHRTDEALDLCEKAWQDCKPDAVASASVLVLYTAKSGEAQWRRVAGWLERESAKKPGDAKLLGSLAAVRRLQKDYRGVVALCRRILELEKSDTLTMNNLAWLLALDANEGAEALKIINRAIELDGPQPGFLGTQGVILMKLGKAQEAVKVLEEAVAESPTTAQHHFHLALAHLRANNRSAAIGAYHQAKRLGLNDDTIDPLEQDAYQQIRVQLEGRSGRKGVRPLLPERPLTPSPLTDGEKDRGEGCFAQKGPDPFPANYPSGFITEGIHGCLLNHRGRWIHRLPPRGRASRSRGRSPGGGQLQHRDTRQPFAGKGFHRADFRGL